MNIFLPRIKHQRYIEVYYPVCSRDQYISNKWLVVITKIVLLFCAALISECKWPAVCIGYNEPNPSLVATRFTINPGKILIASSGATWQLIFCWKWSRATVISTSANYFFSNLTVLLAHLTLELIPSIQNNTVFCCCVNTVI